MAKKKPRKTANGSRAHAKAQQPKPTQLRRGEERDSRANLEATSAALAITGENPPMTQQIAGFPYWEVRFDEAGQWIDGGTIDALLQELPGHSLTDLFFFAHGWNN